MKARPILFSGPMVRALLDGRKTQTRRIVKPRHIPIIEECLRVNGKWVFDTLDFDLGAISGRPGDLLWVRESIDGLCGCDAEYVADRQRLVDAHPAKWDIWRDKRDLPLRTIPSIYMPRWASRLTLELSEVRAERLQDISEADAIGEGIEAPIHIPRLDKTILPYLGGSMIGRPAAVAYADLWESVNGSWDSNPWVWVISFRVHQENINTFLKERAAA